MRGLPATVPDRRTRRGLSDAGAVALAAATAAGAWWSVPVPTWSSVVVATVGLMARRPVVLGAGAALLASGLAASAWEGLSPPTARHHRGEVTLVGDPVQVIGGVQVDARLGNRRVRMQARGGPAEALADRLAGERLEVAGRLGPLSPAMGARLERRHVSGRLTVAEVGAWSGGSPAHRMANGLRRALSAGAAPLGTDRPLFLGMVVGDDRDQSALVADDFRGAGLTHLLAVFGQNVAFVLVLAKPVLVRLGLRSRWLATLGLIAFFALLTRFEPSVLRASAMAAIACTASSLGRPAPRIRILALAVTAVLLVDPLLVGSVGLLLSVGASAGIIVLSAPIAARLPGPRWLAELLGVTLAAQAGVAPVLIPALGALPVASIPANVLAVPAAGPLMVWGLTAGMAAGALGEPFNRWLHVPTRWLLGWVSAVARWAAGLPVGSLRAPQLVALVLIGVASWGAARWWRAAPALGTVLAVGVVVVGALAPAPALIGADDGSGARLWRAGGAVVVVLDDPWTPGVLAQLRDARVDRIDVLVARRGNRLVAGTVLELRQKVPVRLVLAPAGNRIRGAGVPRPGPLAIGGLLLDVTATGPTLEVTVRTP